MHVCLKCLRNFFRLYLSSFEYFRNIALISYLRKANRRRDFIFVKTMYSYILEEQHRPFKQAGTTTILFFHLDNNPVLDHVLVHFVDKTHVLVATVELIWFLLFTIVSFNFVTTPNKSLRLRILEDAM